MRIGGGHFWPAERRQSGKGQEAATVGRRCHPQRRRGGGVEKESEPPFRNKRRPERVEPAGNTIQRHATTEADEGSLHSFHFFFFRADGPRDMSIGTRGVFIAFASPPMSDLSSRVVDLVAPAKAKEKKKKKKSGAKDREWKEPPSESVTRDSPVGN